MKTFSRRGRAESDAAAIPSQDTSGPADPAVADPFYFPDSAADGAGAAAAPKHSSLRADTPSPRVAHGAKCNGATAPLSVQQQPGRKPPQAGDTGAAAKASGTAGGEAGQQPDQLRKQARRARSSAAQVTASAGAAAACTGKRASPDAADQPAAAAPAKAALPSKVPSAAGRQRTQPTQASGAMPQQPQERQQQQQPAATAKQQASPASSPARRRAAEQQPQQAADQQLKPVRVMPSPPQQQQRPRSRQQQHPQPPRQEQPQQQQQQSGQQGDAAAKRRRPSPPDALPRSQPPSLPPSFPGSQSPPVVPVPTAQTEQQPPPGSAVLAPMRPSMRAAVESQGRPEAAKTQTVMQAQERGEQVQVQDDAVYALEGLAAGCSLASQRESALKLAEMMATRKGRLALRSDGLAQQVLSCLAKLKPGKDPVLALAGGACLLALAAEDAHPAYLASTAAAVLAQQLLQVPHSLAETAAAHPPAGRLVKLLARSGPLGRPLAPPAHDLMCSQHSLVLLALVQATGSASASSGGRLQFVDRLKSNMVKYGVLGRLAAVAADYGQLLPAEVAAAAPPAVAAAAAPPAAPPSAAAPDAPPPCGPQPPGSAVWHLQLACLVLEHATFTCPEVERHVVALSMRPTPASDAGGRGSPLAPAPTLPVGLLQLLPPLQAGLVAGLPFCRDCLHAVVAVLMNLTHHNAAGVAAVLEGGGLGAGAALLHQLAQPWQPGEQRVAYSQVAASVELVSVVLGLLINLLASQPAARTQLAEVQLAPAAQQQEQQQQQRPALRVSPRKRKQAETVQGPVAASGSSSVVLQLLCALFSTATAHLQASDEAPPVSPGGGAQGAQAAAAAPGAAVGASPPQAAAAAGASTPGGVQEVTAADMQRAEGAGAASILQVYAAMLLGFLVADQAPLQAAAAGLLPQGGLGGVLAAIRRCLSFYVNAGAITEASRDTLAAMTRRLEQSLGAAGSS